MFLLTDGECYRSVVLIRVMLPVLGGILINEIAPRPHNSGHYTIEACETSQYENHLRAVLGLPLGSTNMKVPSVAMLNLLGPKGTKAIEARRHTDARPLSASSSILKKDPPSIDSLAHRALSIPGATVHLYGKAETRPGRKMGHVTVVGLSDAEVRSRLRPLLLALGVDSHKSIDEKLAPLSQHVDDDGKERPKGFSSKHPLVGVVMGSDSDLPVMRDAARILDGFRVEYELSIVSAHRTPDRLVEYAKSAVSISLVGALGRLAIHVQASRGLKVIIAGAGGAAHLPGMIASMTSLPVIGVPVKGSTLDGVDSLYSIVQMPVGSHLHLHLHLSSFR